jgi:hypothetical protein
MAIRPTVRSMGGRIQELELGTRVGKTLACLHV